MSLLPKDITQMSDAELDELIAGIRDRRNRLLEIYNQGVALKSKAKAEKISAKVEKELAMFGKKLDKVNALLTELENRSVKIVALRLELGDLNVGSSLHGQGENQSA